MNKTATLAGALVGLGVVSSAQAANSCEALWYQRNTIFVVGRRLLLPYGA